MYVQTLLMLHRKLCGDVDVDYHGGGEKCKTKQSKAKQSKCKTAKKKLQHNTYICCVLRRKKKQVFGFLCFSLDIQRSFAYRCYNYSE